jgi:surfeit locus 1 family protein
MLATLACAGLGTWQLQRRVWKLDLIARVEARIHAPPRPLPLQAEWPRINPGAHEYRRVRAEGVFLHQRETLVQAVTTQGAGYWVMTPFRTTAGMFLVNRGFVPPERRDPSTRRAGQEPGTAIVTGLLRMSEPGGGFLRDNDPAQGRWYSRDVREIARARGIGAAAPFFVDADATANPGGYPVGGLTVVSFRNPHLIYAATWFSLAALGAFATARLLQKIPAAP